MRGWTSTEILQEPESGLAAAAVGSSRQWENLQEEAEISYLLGTSPACPDFRLAIMMGGEEK